MNAVEENRWSRGFASLRGEVPPPTAILVISAHWFTDGTLLMANTDPHTIHDFSGFPRALYEIEYPVRGKVELAKHVRKLLGEERATLNADWGLDHGAWSVLRWMYPEAEVPVIQLSIDRNRDVRGHFELARSLSELRDEGVLLLGSGNIVHNLRDAFGRMRAGTIETPEWAQRYDETVKKILTQRDTEALLSMWPDSNDARLAHPTPDHWLPLIYAYGATNSDEHARFPNEGFDWGSISMRNAVFG
jgi:4,5-DOPA dioxygenase extradiol